MQKSRIALIFSYMRKYKYYRFYAEAMVEGRKEIYPSMIDKPDKLTAPEFEVI